MTDEIKNNEGNIDNENDTALDRVDEERKLKIKQRLYMAGIIIVVFVFVVAVSEIMGISDDDYGYSDSEERVIDTSSSESKVSAPEEVWKYKILEDSKFMEDKLFKLEEDVKQRLQDFEKEANEKDDSDLINSNISNEEAVSLRTEIAELRNYIDNLQLNHPDNFNYEKDNYQDDYDLDNGDFGGSEVVGQSRGLRIINLNLEKGEKEKVKTVENTIPAGSFAKATLLSGIDAVTSLNAANDPQPVLIRVVDKGTLPRKFHSDVDDCHVLAGAYGNLSSERVYMRLEKLTCVESLTGEIIETQVAGFITGEDGRTGIRGQVVEKDGAYLSKSLVGGVFSGLANVANTQEVFNPFSGSNTIPTQNVGTRFASGMGQGAGKSLDRLSQYYIDRAEQLQPVIEVASGRIIDVIFTEGTSIGNTEVKEQIENLRKEQRKKIAKDNAAKNFRLSKDGNLDLEEEMFGYGGNGVDEGDVR